MGASEKIQVRVTKFEVEIIGVWVELPEFQAELRGSMLHLCGPFPAWAEQAQRLRITIEMDYGAMVDGVIAESTNGYKIVNSKFRTPTYYSPFNAIVVTAEHLR